MVQSGATEAYERMVADIKERVGYEEYPPVMEEITEYGADQGWGGFTYTTECAEFYQEHKDVIWDLLYDGAESFGYTDPLKFIATFNRADMAATREGFETLLAWYALERVARSLATEWDEVDY